MTSEATQQPSASATNSLRMRILSAAILAPLVIGVIYMGGFPFLLMMMAAAAISSQEWVRMVLTGKHLPRSLVRLFMITAAAGIAVTAGISNPVGCIALLFCGFAFIQAYNMLRHGPSLGLPFLGVIYVTFACAVMLWVRQGDTTQGLYDLLILLLIIWASDIFAYFTGKAIGGPKLAPSISPKKTWAGFWGSSVGAGTVAALMACSFVTVPMEVLPMGGMGPVGYFVLGFILAMFGQAGDLLISVFKRHYGLKDTGNLIPGHGGLLDRIDALLLVALIYGCLLYIL